MLRVVVLGSRPDPQVPSCDHLVAANAAGKYSPDSLLKATSVHLVGLWRGIRDTVEDRTAGERLRAADLRSVVLWNPKAGQRARSWEQSLDERERLLREGCGFDRPITVMTADERRRLWESQTGLREPVVRPALRDPRALAHAALLLAQHRVRVVAAHARATRSRRPVVAPIVPEEFRPSTGVMALSVAIDRFGPSADYCIAGVGLTGRSTYRVAGSDRLIRGNPAARPSSRWVVPPHTWVDRLLLNRLGSRYSVGTTEPDLAAACGLPMRDWS